MLQNSLQPVLRTGNCKNPRKTGSVLCRTASYSRSQGAASYEHKYWGKVWGITQADYEKGSTYYIGCYTDKDIVKEILKMAVKDAGLSDSIPDVCFPVIIRSGVNGDHKKIHYVLHYSEKETTIFCPYDQVKNILDGTSYKKGDRIPLKDGKLSFWRKNDERTGQYDKDTPF